MIDEYNFEIAVASVIFPSNLRFFDVFLNSLSQQTENNFDLILFNDGCNHIELKKHLRTFNDISCRIIDIENKTPSEIRVELIEYIRLAGYRIIVFADTDDYFSNNRIELSVKAINEGANIVVNDLSAVTEEGSLIKERIWRNRLHEVEIDLKFLLRQNVLGLSNTAITKDLLTFDIQVDKKLNLFDWIFYLQIFNLGKKVECRFIDATTYYRQHFANTLGLKTKYTKEGLVNLWEIKGKVYAFAQKLKFPFLQKYILEHERFKREVLDDYEGLKSHILQLNKIENLFWFEEINFSNERNTT